MRLLSTIYVSLSLLFCVAFGNDADGKVGVSVYYSALCGTSKEFFLSDLIITHPILGNVMDLNLVPYGIVERDESTGELHCQHGLAECDANSWEQCIISHYPDPLDYLAMMQCLFSAFDMGSSSDPIDVDLIMNCAETVGLDFDVLQACHDNAEEAGELQEAAMAQTPPDISHVPWIEIDGVRFLESQESLDISICSALVDKGKAPPVCDKILSGGNTD